MAVNKASYAAVTIALDAMGGDHAPLSVIEGAHNALASYPSLRFAIYGDETQVLPLLERFPALKQASTFHHAPDIIHSDTKPSVALRQGRESSMRYAINAVKEGSAVGVVSAGNTGALMAMSKFVLRTLPGIDRPAIASLFPTLTGRCVLLDLGANVECTATNLFQFAIMGDAFARAVLTIDKPRVALLNVGEEEIKGHEDVKAASVMLKETPLNLNFTGYVEGDGIPRGVADVIVTDGFTGNIALKTAEGTARICKEFIKQGFQSSLLAKIGALLAASSLRKVFKKIDPRLHNGAMFLGLDGIAVKSHGSADAIGFANAIGVAVELAVHDINSRIREEITTAYHHQTTASGE